MARTRTPVKREVLIRRNDLGSFLDMLRHDGCTVDSWGTDITSGPDRETYSVMLRSAPDRTPGFEFTVDRWRSFGINISDPVR